MFDVFFDTAEKYKDNPAFIYKKAGKTVAKTYGQFFCDILRMVSLIKAQGIRGGEKIILLIKPSYNLYVFMYAAIYCKLNIVMSPLNKSALNRATTEIGAKYVASSGITRILKNFLPLKGLKNISIDAYGKYAPQDFNFSIDANTPIMTVFSGGGTGAPKAVERTAADLDTQLKLIGDSISDFGKGGTSLTLMPNYVMATLVAGVANVLFFKNLKRKSNIKKLYRIADKNKVSTIIASVSKFAALNKPLPTIKKAYTGGSPMSLSQIDCIKAALPNADFTYIYGCTEVPVVAKTTLQEYEKNMKSGRICVGEIIDFSSVIIGGTADVGKIYVCPKNNTFAYTDKNAELLEIDEKLYFFTGDYGYTMSGKLYLSGRHGFSKLTATQVFNYEKELSLTRNYALKRCVYIFYGGKEYLITEKATKNQLSAIKAEHPNLHILNTRKIPLENRHNSKPHFENCIRLLQNDVFLYE